MAGVERLELPTIGFGDRCSTNWNYTPTMHQQQKFAKAIVTLIGRILVFKGIKRYSRSEALLYSAKHISQVVFSSVIKFQVKCFEFIKF